MAKLLIIGCGAIGSALALHLTAQGHQVTGLKRHPPLENNGINYIAADLTVAGQLQKLPDDFDAVFFIVSADGRTEQSYRTVYETGLGNALAKFQQQPWFFVSSTSVYGQNQGEWVDENSPTEPSNITSQLICQAEQRLLAANANSVIVRFSGIYGPGREYLLRSAQQSPSIQQTPPYYTNRIHQQDCVGVLAFLLAQRLAGVALNNCYLASDDNPATMWEVISWLAEQLNCPAPTVKSIEGIADQNKRCQNQRLKALGYVFRYPDYQAGYGELIKR